jgi:phage repressor protein C with HTH and peptisase S24 domain
VYLSENIKYLRGTLNLNQAEFGKLFDLTRDNIASYERGSFPRIDVLNKIVEHFHISLDDIVNLNISEVGLENIQRLRKNETHIKKEDKTVHLNEPENVHLITEPTPKTYTKKVDIVVSTQDTTGNATVPMINHQAAANYLTGYQSQEYFEELEPLTLPSYMMRSGQHYALQVLGNSMESTLHDGDWLVCRLLEPSEYEYMQDGLIYVIVCVNRGIQVKRIKNRLKNHGNPFIRCRSDNRAHAPYNVYPQDIVQIWIVEWQLTAYMPNREEMIYNKLDAMQERIEDLEIEMRARKK